MKKCEACGNENNDNNLYCISCGARLIEEKPKSGEDLFFQTEFKKDARKINSSALTLGIIALSISIALFFFIFVAQIAGFVLGILALILGIKDMNNGEKGKCTAAIILGILAIIISLALFILYTVSINEIMDEILNEFRYGPDDGTSSLMMFIYLIK